MKHKSTTFSLHRSKSTGFTIVELLIVIVVIAILAAITIVAYNGIQDRARSSAASQGLSSAMKKIMYWQAQEDTTAAPSTLAAAGVSDTESLKFQYNPNLSGTYCITATVGNKSYKATGSNKTPTEGGCAGHGVGGVAAVTNYFHDPKPTSASAPATAWGSTNTMTFTNVSASWSQSGRANRISFPVINNAGAGGPTLRIDNTYPVGQRFTITASIRLTAGPGRLGGISLDRNSQLGNLTYHASQGTQTDLTIGQTHKIAATFTADATALADGLRAYIQIANKTTATVVEFADIMLYPGDYDASRNWRDGDSTDWVWTGTPNNSPSTGPPQS